MTIKALTLTTEGFERILDHYFACEGSTRDSIWWSAAKSAWNKGDFETAFKYLGNAYWYAGIHTAQNDIIEEFMLNGKVEILEKAKPNQ